MGHLFSGGDGTFSELKILNSNVIECLTLIPDHILTVIFLETINCMCKWPIEVIMYECTNF